MDFLVVLLLVCGAARLGEAGYFYGRPETLNFPLRSVDSSIRAESFGQTQQNITVGRCEHVSGRRIVLNLEELGLYPPPNPYPGFIDGPYVTCVNLAGNGINQVARGSFDLVPELRYLDLSRNRLQLCDLLNLGRLPHGLETLVIEDNEPPFDNIRRVIGQADCLPRLHYLYLRRNAIRSLDFSLRKSYPELTHLFLSDNHLDRPTFIRDLPESLTHVFLERNSISSLDCRVARNIQELHLDGNLVGSVCLRRCQDTALKLAGVHHLRVLTLSSNRITDIESCAFLESPQLEVLNLADNQLDHIPREAFAELHSLHVLNLDDNHLREVPHVCQNRKLTHLSLRRNQLDCVRRESLRNLRELKALYLGGNQIRSVEPGAFEDLECLTELDLSHNHLDHLPADFARAQRKLRVLDVRGNRFQSLESLALTSAPYLTTIYLQNNPVTHISGDIVRNLGQGLVIHLKNDCLPATRSNNHCYSMCEDRLLSSSVTSSSRNETYSRWVNGY